jgi:hypothetical protein
LIGYYVVALTAKRRKVVEAILAPLSARRIAAVVDLEVVGFVAEATAAAVALDGSKAQCSP